MWLWASYLPSLCLNFLNYKMGIYEQSLPGVVVKINWDNMREAWKELPAQDERNARWELPAPAVYESQAASVNVSLMHSLTPTLRFATKASTSGPHGHTISLLSQRPPAASSHFDASSSVHNVISPQRCWNVSLRCSKASALRVLPPRTGNVLLRAQPVTLI